MLADSEFSRSEKNLDGLEWEKGRVVPLTHTHTHSVSAGRAENTDHLVVTHFIFIMEPAAEKDLGRASGVTLA